MSEPTLNTEQAAPADGVGPDCWQLVLADMTERREVGIAKYGTPLRPDNGRDALIDAYQEVLDLAVYLRAAIEQRKTLKATIAQVLPLLRKRGWVGAGEGVVMSSEDSDRAIRLLEEVTRE